MTTESSNLLKHTKSGALKKAMIKRFHDLAIDQIIGVAPKSILDAGCGEGFFLTRAKEAGLSELYGFDWSADAIRLAQNRTKLPSGHLWQSDLCEDFGSERYFDAICCFEVLEHLANPRIGLDNIRDRRARHIFLSVPKEPFFCLGNLFVGKNITRLGNDIDHKQLWTKRGFKKFVQQSLCTIYSIQPFDPAIFPWTLIKCTRIDP
jgi:2-polyprenyl-3-methyl-5-hydroxy-6-metoxy-1,4-benzoquinol methylase